MLNLAYRAALRPGAQNPPPSRQTGVVLIVSLIILVALTIGGIALVRSIDTTSMISGNLAFQQAATRAGEAGTETAMRSFIAAVTTTPTDLWSDDFARAYRASSVASGSTANWWDTYWFNTINPNNQVLPGQCSDGSAGGGRVCVLPIDPVTGNTVSYTIERLCQAAGNPGLTATTGCARGQQPSPSTGESLSAGGTPLQKSSQYFYRITTRVAGPRNTSSYIQTIVAR